MCSEEEGLKKEIDHLKFVFSKINRYPDNVIKNTLKSLEEKIRIEALPNVSETNTVVVGTNVIATEHVIHQYMVLPYKGYLGNQILKKFKNKVFNLLPASVSPRRYNFQRQEFGFLFSCQR